MSWDKYILLETRPKQEQGISNWLCVTAYCTYSSFSLQKRGTNMNFGLEVFL